MAATVDPPGRRPRADPAVPADAPAAPRKRPEPPATTDHPPAPPTAGGSTTDHPPTDDASRPAPPFPAAIGRFRVRSRLGAGAFGEVFRAHDPQLDREVALKVAKPGTLDTADRTGRFRREARAAANLRHPHIVPVFDSGQDGDRHYIASGFVDGRTLEAEIEGGGGRPPDLSRAAAVVRKLADALGYAHRQGVVHRDVKPANVLVDDAGEPSLTDFGLAMRAGDEAVQTQDGRVMGTPAYMSPEQAAGRSAEATAASDQYALGVVLYEMCTGRRPFGGPVELVIFQQVRVEPRRPRGVNGAIPKDLETVILTCLEKDPRKRYASCAALGEDLRRFLAGEPVAARRIGPAERFGRWCKRNPAVASSVSFGVLALVVGLVAAVAQADVARREANRADAKAREAEDRAKAEAEAKGVAETEKGRAERQLDRSERLVYAGKLSLAQSAFAEGNGALALQHLDECRWDLRGWEYRHLWTRFNAKQTLLGHTGAVTGVAFSPDGKRIATGSWDQTAKVWDAATGRELLTLNGHTQEVYGVALSPDGKRIATGSEDQTAKVWDAATGRELLTLNGHTQEVNSVAFSPDGKRIVTGSGEVLDERGEAKVWDAATGRELLALNGHTSQVRSATFSPDGKRIVVGTTDSTVKVWDADTGREVFALNGHTGSVTSAAWCPDGTRIVTSSWDDTVKVWDAGTGRELLTFTGHTGPVESASWSPDGTRIVTGGSDHTARVWDAGTGRELLALKGQTNDVQSAAWCPDGRRIVTGSRDHTARVWDADTGHELRTLKGHTRWVTSAAFDSAGRRIATGSRDHTARVWDAGTGRELVTLKGHTGDVTSVAFRSDGKRIVTGSYDNTAKVWEVPSAKPEGGAGTGRELLTLKGHANWVLSAAWSPDGKWIVTGGFDHTAKVWDAGTGRELLTLNGHTSSVRSAAWSPDGKWIVTGGFDHTAKVWDAGTGRELLTLNGHTSAAFSPDGRRIVTGGFDHTAKVWDADTGQERLVLRGHTSAVVSAAWCPDGTRIVTVSDDGTARVWDADTGQERLTLKGLYTSVAFSADGTRMVAAGDSNTAKVCVADKGPERLTVKGHTKEVRRVAFSSDGTRLFAWDAGSEVLAWSTAGGQPVDPVDPPPVPPPGPARSPDGSLRAVAAGKSVYVTDARRPGDNAWPLPDAAERMRYHTERAARAENESHWFAVAFHLGRLLLEVPDDADLTRRRAAALQRHQAAHPPATIPLAK
jgi:WD40 repeat protein/tRNA A-37 threonylcarbamoyl transferase component Bud32